VQAVGVFDVVLRLEPLQLVFNGVHGCQIEQFAEFGVAEQLA
jgi:hypothetical protein